MTPRWSVLVAAVLGCAGPAPEAAEAVGSGQASGADPADIPMPEEPVELLTPEIRRACAGVAQYWQGDPAASVRTLDSVVTRPREARTTDACWVMVRIEDDRGTEEARVPFAAAGWLALPEFDVDGSSGRSRVWQLDPVRCLVTERWDAAPSADTLVLATPWFEQAVACFRRQ